MTRVFISYKSDYRDFAQRLRDILHGWGFSTWLDVDDIPEGAYFRHEIQKGLDSSDFVVGVVTPEAIQSREVMWEWDYALDKKRLVPLIYRPTPLPYHLNGTQYIDLTVDEHSALERLRRVLVNPADFTQPPPPKVEAAALPKSKIADSNRKAMLQIVHNYWIKGVLEPTLHSGSLDIGLQIKPDAMLKHKDYGDYDLPEDADILRVFEDMQRELLILGAPGAGKTTLMLQLAEKLLDRAEVDDKQPIPVVFNLSSWAAKREPLDQWLQERLRQDYQIPKKLAQQWIENPTLLLLLDGLDEVAEEHREACIAAINTFRRGYSWVDVVVCSRIEEYERLTTQLDLHGAVVLQPLTSAEIELYLNKPGLEGVRELVRTDPIVREMAETPFLLNAIGVAFKNELIDKIKRKRASKDWKIYIFDQYVYKRYKTHTKYSLKNTRNYLIILSYHLFTPINKMVIVAGSYQRKYVDLIRMQDENQLEIENNLQVVNTIKKNVSERQDKVLNLLNKLI